ncbi:MAG: DUF2283 domain-containing protein [Desulfatiglandales bacterium]
MKLNYYPETNFLYIDLSSKPSKESAEISEGIVLDYDGDEHIIGVDINNASRKIDLDTIILKKLLSQLQDNSLIHKMSNIAIDQSIYRLGLSLGGDYMW